MDILCSNDHSKLQYVVKLVISGQYFELSQFEISPRAREKQIKSTQFKTKEERIENYIDSENLLKNHSTTKRKIERLIRCNTHLTKFLTLTFKENTIDISIANPLFHNFVARLRRQYPEFQYICIPEFQERGAVHYHLLCYLPYVPSEVIGKIWQLGFIKIKRTDQVKNMAKYLTKYLTKKSFDGRLFGKKKFFCSKELNRPAVYYDWDAINIIGGANNLEVIYERKFDSYFGEAKYVLYESHDLPNFIKINPISTAI